MPEAPKMRATFLVFVLKVMVTVPGQWLRLRDLMRLITSSRKSDPKNPRDLRIEKLKIL